ncbi:MAG: energy-coupling factor transporter transmembrane component T [Bacillota bacterium]
MLKEVIRWDVYLPPYFLLTEITTTHYSERLLVSLHHCVTGAAPRGRFHRLPFGPSLRCGDARTVPMAPPIRWALVSYIRILALILASIFYFSTNRERDILAGFRSMGMPFVVSYFFGLALRSAGMFIEDLRTVREAEQARGLDYSVVSFKDKLKFYAMYMIPLFTLALRRGDEISNALFARGYSFGGKPPGGKRVDYVLTKYSMSIFDKPLIALLGVAFLALVFIKFKYNLFSVDNSIVNSFFNLN